MAILAACTLAGDGAGSNRMRAHAFRVLAVLLAMIGAVEAGDFPVNSTGATVAGRPSIAQGPDGGFLAAWYIAPTPAQVRGRLFGPGPAPLGPDFAVSQTGASTFSSVGAARLPDGSYAVVWSEYVQVFPHPDAEILPSLDYCYVLYRRIAADGSPLGATVTVASSTIISGFGYCVGSSTVAAQPDGSWIVGYTDMGSSGPVVKAQRFPSQGNLPLELSATSGVPRLAVGPAGELAATWWVGDQVMLRLFATDGTPQGPEFQVNTLGGVASGPALVYDASGVLRVVWASTLSDGGDVSGTSIQARYLAADGTFLSPQYQLNSLFAGNQQNPRVSAQTDGTFTVVWQSESSGGSDGLGYSIQARRLLADGTPLGPEVQVNTMATGDQTLADVSAATASPTFAWVSQGFEIRSVGDLFDLAVTITDNAGTTVPGATLQYVAAVTNPGSVDAFGAPVSVVFPAAVSCTWTCSVAGGASCAGGPHTGDVADVVNVPIGGAVTYQASCLVGANAAGTLVAAASVGAPPGQSDVNPGNNSATDTTNVQGVVVDDLVHTFEYGTAFVPVRLLFPDAAPVTVEVSTSDGTATAGSDYEPLTQVTLTFDPGETETAAEVLIDGDGVFETDETFFVTLGNANGAAIVDGLAVVTIQNDDAAQPSGSLDELAQGSSEVRTLQSAPGGVPVEQDWRLSQAPLASYEVVVDGVTGDLGPQGPALERMDFIGLIAQRGTGTGSSQSMRWESAGQVSPVNDERIRVQSRGCIDDCDAADVFRIRMWETTGFFSRFNNSATQVTVVLLQNPTAEPVLGHLAFFANDGTWLSYPTFALEPGASLALNTSSIFVLQGQSGSIRVTSDAPYGALQGKAVAVEPATGFSFDTPLVPRPR